MDTYVRTSLLPYDFALTAEQETELFRAVRAALEETSDEELFSSIIWFKVDEVVDGKIRPWRDAIQLNEQLNRLKELRGSAADYVSTFLNGQATPTAIDQLKQHFGIQDAKGLEVELRKRIEEWLSGVEDSELLQYEGLSVQAVVLCSVR